jgi:DNA polymerase-3 subunit chi
MASTSPVVRFHYNVADRLGYVADMLAKASRRRLPAVVLGPAPTLDALSRKLWTWNDTAFVAHRRWSPGEPAPAARHERVWLIEQLQLPAVPWPSVLINLGDGGEPGLVLGGPGLRGGAVSLPPGVQTLVEVIALDADDRDAGRRRWKQYHGLGYRVEPVDALGSASSPPLGPASS